MIRIATENDAEELLNIYAPYVEKTAITFEYEVPSVEEFRIRIRNILKKYPYIVEEKEGEILGYAYAGVFKNRAAYDWAVETTIYVREDQRKSGVGRALYEGLENILKMQNILNLNACIAYTAVEDEHLTNNSVHLCVFPSTPYHTIAQICYRIVETFQPDDIPCGHETAHYYS